MSNGGFAHYGSRSSINHRPAGNKMKKKMKKKIIEIGKENILTGKQLVDMGYKKDSEGMLIATTLKYSVFIRPVHYGGWLIKQRSN